MQGAVHQFPLNLTIFALDYGAHKVHSMDDNQMSSYSQTRKGIYGLAGEMLP